MPSAKKSANPVVALTSGCIAGGVEAMCVWPLEYVKASLEFSVVRGNVALFVVHQPVFIRKI